MNQFNLRILITIICTFSATSLCAQIDSIRFSKVQMVVGEIKSMNKGVLVVETDFSEKDFEIEWDEVTWITTQSRFFITLKQGERFYGKISMVNDSMKQATVNRMDGISFQLVDIVYLEAYNDKFADRLKAELSVGFDMAKSRNLRTLSTRGLMAYKAEKWTTDISLNSLTSAQDNTETIKRIDGEFNYRFIAKKRWYGIGSITTLSNTEQNLELRLNAQLGFGRFFIRTNKTYWGAKLGVNRNKERYSNDTVDRSSWEGYVGTELNLFDMGDIDLLFLLMVYPSFTESGRLRSDTRFDLKYDLPLDFFIKIGTSVNFDNSPAEDGSKTDYVLQSTFGWEW